jgi:ParB family chromosome partitioning protein
MGCSSPTKTRGSSLMEKENNSGAVSLLKKLRNENNTSPSNLDTILEKKKKLKSSQTETTEKKSINNTFNLDEIYEIDPFLITRWKYKDRPTNELGDIQGLAKTISEIGQQVPCIVRPIKENTSKYELIAGERRWKAVETLGIKLKCIIQDIDDRTAALVQAVENEKRDDLSDFAKGMSYAEKIDQGILQQKDLTNILGISRLQVSRLLSFSKVDPDIKESIDNFQQISARTCAEINRLSSKGDEYKNIIKSISDKLRNGSIGANKLEKIVSKRLEKDEINKENNIKKVQSNDGRHLFTWRLDNNKSPSIHFPKAISNLISNNKIKIEDLSKDIENLLLDKLNKI